jgi:hypothetical protein
MIRLQANMTLRALLIGSVAPATAEAMGANRLSLTLP